MDGRPCGFIPRMQDGDDVRGLARKLVLSAAGVGLLGATLPAVLVSIATSAPTLVVGLACMLVPAVVVMGCLASVARATGDYTRVTLVVGVSGFVGSCYAQHLMQSGLPVVTAGRREGLDVVLSTSDRLDAVLAQRDPEQVVVTAQLAEPATGWILERIDGPRWLVISSALLASVVPAPGRNQALAHEELARERGAVVLRPTMIFGRGKDLNVTRLLRQISRLRTVLQVGGEQLLQPLHIDDLSALMERHFVAPETREAGALISVGGSEQLPVAKLLDDLKQLACAVVPRPVLPTRALAGVARAAGMLGLRSDQVARLSEDKIVDNSAACALFGWEPAPLAVRLEQAYLEGSTR